MLGRSGSWIGNTIAGLTLGRFWLYQDFAPGSGPAIVLTDNNNGTGLVFDASRVVNGSAVVTTTNGNAIYNSATHIPANLVTVSAHTGANVTLSSTPSVGEGSVRVWYLYSMSTAEAPTNVEIAPHFVTSQRTQFLDTEYLNQNLNLSDLANAASARTNLGFATITAGAVLIGDGGTTPTSDPTKFFWDVSNTRLGIGTNTPAINLDILGADAVNGIRIKAGGTAAGRYELRAYNNDFFTIERPSSAIFAFSISNTDQVAVGTLGGVSGATFSASSTALDRIVSVFRGNSSQTANPTEWHTSTDTILSFVNSVGSAQFPTVTLKTSLVVEDPGAGTFTVTLQAPTLASSYTLTLPVDDGTPNQVLKTDGSGVLSWVTGGTGTVNSGTAGRLALYATTTTAVSDTYVQNANNINVAIASHATLASTRTYTVPDAGADASFLMTQGAQTIVGLTTFSATPLLKAGIDVEDPGAGTNKVTLTTGVVSASYTITLPLVQGAANSTLVNSGAGIMSWTVPTFSKSGTVVLSVSTTTKAIVFGTARADALYTVLWSFKNSTDGTPAQRAWNVIAQSTTGFTIEWNDALDTANYVGYWAAIGHYDP